MPNTGTNDSATETAWGADAADNTLEQQWAHIAGLLRVDIGDNNHRSWIAPVEPVSVGSGVLALRAPTRFVRDWVRTHYGDRIRLLWSQHYGAVARVDIAAGETAARPVVTGPGPANDSAQDEETDLSSPLDARLTFAHFVTGPANAMAAGALKRLTTGEDSYNPLFVHGGVGLGKTHLLQAAAAEIRKTRPGTKVVYMSAERFMYRFVEALRKKDTMAFKAFFRSTDVLMIDDVQFICGKESTQEEFFHTFNTLLDQGANIVLTADRPPAALDDMDERLKSRFAGGLVVQVHAPDRDLRLNILKSKCALLNRNVPEDVLAFLADNITASVRELEGALNRLIAHTELAEQEITIDTATMLLQDVLRAADRRVTVEDIQKQVCSHFGLSMADLLSPRRARHMARPRQIAMYLSKQLTTLSLPDIGRRFAGRDHTTIMHGVRRIEALIRDDAQIRDDVEALTRALRG